MSSSHPILRWRMLLTILACGMSIFAFLRRPDTTPVDFSVELRLSRISVTTGEVVVPEMVLRNVGPNAARHLKSTIRLYINGERWLDEPIYLPKPGSTETLTRTSGWTATSPGTYEFTLKVDESKRLNDTDRKNNSVMQLVTVSSRGP